MYKWAVTIYNTHDQYENARVYRALDIIFYPFWNASLILTFLWAMVHKMVIFQNQEYSLHQGKKG